MIEYLLVENRVLRQKLGKRRILLNEEQRRRLAVKGKILGRKMLEQVAGIVTPETILRWHREWVARHWDYSKRRQKAGRPAIAQETVDLILKLAKENPRWGYKRIQEAIANFAAHYHAERNHQGIGNQLLLPGEEVGRRSGAIACRERLGGLLRYYYREAA